MINEDLIKLYPDILSKLKKAKQNHSFFCTNFLKILTKEGTISPFVLNNIQLDFLNFLNNIKNNNNNNKRIRKVIILKARQFGMSTFIESYFFHKILFNKGKKAFVVAHQQQSTDSIFKITDLFYKKLPNFIKEIYPKQTNNTKEIAIKYNESSIRIGTAGGKEIGRGTTNNYIHASEVAFWDNPEIIMASLLESMAETDDNIAICESTANGFNFFEKEFKRGLKKDSDTISIFYGWNKFLEYRKPIIGMTKNEFYETMDDEEKNLQKIYKLSLEQINWRRDKIKNNFERREHLFKQEYPLIWQEAFINPITQPLIEYIKIQEARNNNLKENELEPIIVGIDTARSGNDRTVITVRRGRKILKIFTLINKRAPEIEGFIINKVVNVYNPDKIFIDAAYGLDIADHLKENGYNQIEAIFFNSHPDDTDSFVNIRSEMHEKVRIWFYQDGGVDIKDDDEICNEYSIIPDLKLNSLGKKYMIEKDEIKKLNSDKSPDYMDSLALTFAKPVIKKLKKITKEIRIIKK